MDDIRRRLDLGRAGRRSAARRMGSSNRSTSSLRNSKISSSNSKPAARQQSAFQQLRAQQPADGRERPGEVTKKNIGSKSGWGDLPPKEREEAMQQIGRDFPSHYRDAIEQYFAG